MTSGKDFPTQPSPVLETNLSNNMIETKLLFENGQVSIGPDAC